MVMSCSSPRLRVQRQSKSCLSEPTETTRLEMVSKSFVYSSGARAPDRDRSGHCWTSGEPITSTSRSTITKRSNVIRVNVNKRVSLRLSNEEGVAWRVWCRWVNWKYADEMPQAGKLNVHESPVNMSS